MNPNINCASLQIGSIVCFANRVNSTQTPAPNLGLNDASCRGLIVGQILCLPGGVQSVVSSTVATSFLFAPIATTVSSYILSATAYVFVPIATFISSFISNTVIVNTTISNFFATSALISSTAVSSITVSTSVYHLESLDQL